MAYYDLAGRVFKSRGQPHQDHSVMGLVDLTGDRPTKYKQYDNSKLARAIVAVTEGNMSTRRAALEFGVPQSTLSDNVRGRVLFGTSSGHKRYLNNDEEEELVNFIVKCAEIGYAYSVKEIMILVQDTIDKKGIQATVSHGWWEGYKKRHPDLVKRKPEPLTHMRVKGMHPSILEKYFEILECTVKDNDLIDRPAQIFNMDETGMPLDPKAPFIVARRGQKHPSYTSSGSKAQITVLACCNAAGYTLPPYVIFDKKILKPELTTGEVPNTLYGLSENGWIDSELFHLWFENHFLAYAPAARPLLLVMDGHSSHYNPDTIHMAAENGVIMFCLPPNTTHQTQPLDKGCFSPLKSHWKSECNKYLKTHPGKVVTRFQFSELFANAWIRGMSVANVIQGFKVTGIYPYNPHALLPKPESSLPSSRFHNIGADAGLKFLPLFSPVPPRYCSKQSCAVNDDYVDQDSSLEADSILSPQNEQDDFEFTPEEVSLFSRRFEEGYDMYDERYEMWKQRNQLDDQHSCHETSTIDKVQEKNLSLQPQSKLMRRLFQEPPSVPKPSTIPDMTKTSSARVLTSRESLRILDEKKKKKEDELLEKERRRKEREVKRALKQDEIAEKERRKKEREAERAKKKEELLRKEQKRKEMEAKKQGKKPSKTVCIATNRDTEVEKHTEVDNYDADSVAERTTRQKRQPSFKSQAKKPSKATSNTTNRADTEVDNHTDSVAEQTITTTAAAKRQTSLKSQDGEVEISKKKSQMKGKKLASVFMEANKEANEVELESDEHEYCICNGKVRCGVMIGCDNESCPVGWWHLKCAGLKSEPKEDEWICSICRQ